MITLYLSETGAVLGTLTEDQLQELSDQLEEEWANDEDYYINQDTVDMLQEAGVSSEVIAILSRALAETGEADIYWAR